MCRGSSGKPRLQRVHQHRNWSTEPEAHWTTRPFSYSDPADKPKNKHLKVTVITPRGRGSLNILCTQNGYFQIKCNLSSCTLNIWAFRMWWPSSIVCCRFSFPSWRDNMKAMKAWPVLEKKTAMKPRKNCPSASYNLKALIIQVIKRNSAVSWRTSLFWPIMNVSQLLCKERGRKGFKKN